MKFGQFVATQESLGVEPITDMELEQTNTEVVEAAAVITGEGESIVKTDDAIEDAFAAADRLGEATSILSKDSGDLSPQTVAAMESLYSSIMTGLGMDEDRITMESNGDSRAAWITTMESKQEGIFSKIITAIKGIINTAIGFISNLFKSKYMLEKYITGLEEKVKASDDFGTSDVQAMFPDFESANKALGQCSFNLEITQAGATVSKEIAKAVKDIGSHDDTAVDKHLDKLMSVTSRISFEGYAGGDKLKAKGDESQSKAEVNIPLLELEKGKGADKAKALTKSQALDLLKSAKAVLGELKALKDIDGALRTFLGKIKDGVMIGWNTAKLKSSDPVAAGKAMIDVFLHKVRLTMRVIARNFASILPSLAFKNIKAAADYVKASLNTSK